MPLLFWIIGLYFSYIGRTDAEQFNLKFAEAYFKASYDSTNNQYYYFGKLFEVSKRFQFTYNPKIKHINYDLRQVIIRATLKDFDLFMNVKCLPDFLNHTYKIYMHLDNKPLKTFDILYRCEENVTFVKLNLKSSETYIISIALTNFTFFNTFDFETSPGRLTDVILTSKPNSLSAEYVIENNIDKNINAQLFEYNIGTETLADYNQIIAFHENGVIDAYGLLPGKHYLLRLSGPCLYKNYNFIWMTLNIRVPVYLSYDYNSFAIMNTDYINRYSPVYDFYKSTDIKVHLRYTDLPKDLRCDKIKRGTVFSLKIREPKVNFTEQVFFVSDFVGEIGFLQSVRTDYSVHFSWKETVEAAYHTMVYIELIEYANFKRQAYLSAIVFDKNYETINGLEPGVDYLLRICLQPRYYFCLTDKSSKYYNSCKHCKDRHIDKIDFKVKKLSVSNIFEQKILVYYDLGTNASSESKIIYVYGAKNVKSLLMLQKIQLNIFTDNIELDSNIFMKLASINSTETETRLTIDIPIKSSVEKEFLKWVYDGFPYFIAIVICQEQFCYQSMVNHMQNASDLVISASYVVLYCSIFVAGFFNMICIYVIVIQSKIGYARLHLKVTLKPEATINPSETNNNLKKQHISQIDSNKNIKFVQKRHVYPIEKDFVGSDERGYIFRVINKITPLYRKKKISFKSQVTTETFLRLADLLNYTTKQEIPKPLSELDDDDNDDFSSEYKSLPYYPHMPELVKKVDKEGVKLHVAYTPGLYGPASYIIGSFTQESTGIDMFDLLFDHQVKTMVLLYSKEAMDNISNFKYFFDANKGMQKWNLDNNLVVTLCMKSSMSLNIFLCRIDKIDETRNVIATVETRIYQFCLIDFANNITNIPEFMIFRKRVAEYHCMSKYPLLVLCNNGFKLCATFITIDYNIQLLDAGSEFVNITGFLETLMEIMNQRNFSTNQRNLIIKAIKDYLESRNEV